MYTKDDVFISSPKKNRKLSSSNIESSDEVHKYKNVSNYEGDKSGSSFFDNKSNYNQSESSGVHLSFLNNLN